MFISITRLRLRHWWYIPEFTWRSNQSIKQARGSQGFRAGRTLLDRHQTFWTLTGWDSEAAMRAYRGSGAHKVVMPKLANWCDEAAVAHYNADELPSWIEAWEQIQNRPLYARQPSFTGPGGQANSPSAENRTADSAVDLGDRHTRNSYPRARIPSIIAERTAPTSSDDSVRSGAASVNRYDTLFVPSASGAPEYCRTYSILSSVGPANRASCP